MFIYLLMIGLVAFGCFFYMQFPYVTTRKENNALIGPYAEKCYFHPMFILILVILLFPYVIRFDVGTDFSAYYAFYEWHQELTLQEIMEKRDFGYYLLEKINGKLSNNNWYFHCTVVGLLTYFPIVYYYSRYSNNIAYTMLIYIMFMEYFSAYNAVRQTLASSFLIIAFVLMMERKYAKTIIAVFIAYSFHSTVLLIIPIFLLCFLRYDKKSGYFIKGVLIILAVTLQSVWNNILSFLTDIGQDKLVTDYSDVDLTGVKGANILRIAVYFVPVILVLIFGKRIIIYVENSYGENSLMVKHTNFIFNACQFAFIFMIAAQKNWIFARFSSYLAIFIPVLLSFVYPVVKKQYRSLFCIVSVILFLIYMCMLLPVESNLLPYRTEWGWYYK